MVKLNQGRSRRGGGLGARLAILGLLAIGSAAVLAGCDDPLPGFANPPPYDGGDGQPDASDDEDAG